MSDGEQLQPVGEHYMEEGSVYNSNVAVLKSMGVDDEDRIREALQQTGNTLHDAVQLLFPESTPPYSTQSSGFERNVSSEVDMQDTHVSCIDSDQESTTVSYNLDEDRMRDLHEMGEAVEFNVTEEAEEGGEGGGMGLLEDVEREVESQPPHSHPLGPPPSYDIAMEDQNLSVVPDDAPQGEREGGLGDMDDIEKEDIESPPSIPTDSQLNTSAGSSEPQEFPLTHYYELEGRVHTEQWSIPYKKEESLGVCMIAVVKMMKEGPGVAEADENCVKFLEKTMFSAFEKLMTHDAVYRWDEPIQKGIREMGLILMELISLRLTYPPIPVYLLQLLGMTFSADNSFHSRNRSRKTNALHWQKVLGEEQVFAISPTYATRKDPKGWLVEQMNTFAQHGGIRAIKAAILKSENIKIQEVTALFQPFSMCDDYINSSFFKAEMGSCMQFALKYVEDLSDDALKDKEVGCIFDLLKTIKTLLRRCSIVETNVDTLRLSTTLRMFKIPHYNAKMNALKEVVKLTEEPYSPARGGVKNPIQVEKVRRWLIENKVLSIAFGGNLHQAQYCDKVKSIVEFLGNQLSVEELSTIWEMQVDKNPAQVENIHSILAHAASRFTAQHMDSLFHLIQNSWESASSDRYREKLLGLIGKIGKDDRTGKTASKILELLWSLAHLPQLSREMVELALDSHYHILIDSFHMKDHERRVYINKCVEDIKKTQWVVAAVRQIHRLAKGMFHSSYAHKDQQQIAELQKQYDLLRLTCATMSRVHIRTVQLCHDKGEELTGETIMDGRYTHEEFVDTHLQFMAFLLQEGALYLPTKRANDIWDTLVHNPDACAADRRLAFKWFDTCITDLEMDTQQALFQKQVLRVNPAIIDISGYHCIKTFFETINLSERKLRKMHSGQLVIDDPELTGIEYLWKACLEVKEKRIADELINSILQISYSSLSPKMKRDPTSLHHRFISECFSRLESLIDPPEDMDREMRILAVERLLLLAESYITTVEENHPYPRHMPPHGACFRGHHITLYISADQQQMSFRIDCHSNESLLSVRQKIAQKLGVVTEQLQMGTSEKWLNQTHYNKLIHQLGFSEGQQIIVKTSTMGTYVSTMETNGSKERLQAALKQEKQLPGVIMTQERDVFTKVELLCRSGESRITSAVRSLLKLIPINPQVLEALEVFIHQKQEGASDESYSQPSPEDVLKEFFDVASISPTQLLYNLEVLSGKLMPAETKSVDEMSTQLFKKNFLESGGLKYVINVLQKDVLPAAIDPFVRQDCYAVALSLARFLLCAARTQTIPVRQRSSGSQNERQASPDGVEDMEDQPSIAPPQRQLSKSISVEEEVARLTIETMSLEDYQTTLAYLMRVCWAAAAGQLHLASSADSSQLKSGLCIQQHSVSGKDAGIARESVELLATCLKLRHSYLNLFYTLPQCEEFIVDVLLGSPNLDIRAACVSSFYDLCYEMSTICADLPSISEEPHQAKRPRSIPTETPSHFFTHLLLNTPTPFWKSSPDTEEETLLWRRSSKYFEMLNKLLDSLTIQEQEMLSVNVLELLQKELEWLDAVTMPEPPCHPVQTVLTGHLKLCTALLSCEGVKKEPYSQTLVPNLLSKFLFPASQLTVEAQSPPSLGILNISPKCCVRKSRVAAYRVLVELARFSFDNFSSIVQHLITIHHARKPSNTKEWEFRPLVEGRSSCGYVGLKNAGATCYMNTVLQQLYIQPGLKESILSVERDEEDTSIFPEIQTIFGHLLESKLQYFTPDNFWKVFKIDGQPVNVHEHQDASEFFASVTDQVDEIMKKRNCRKVFEERFGGKFLDQMICHGCEHTFENQQSFTTLQLSVVQSKSLTESLQEFVRGDMLEGDNRYLCGECQEKRDTLKRTCIKVLPHVLVVHLKRFDYDWETNREIKFNNYFEFPLMLDMEPYTATGITSREKGQGVTPQQLYELTGIIVHQGQASAGHYYAFIKHKDRDIDPSVVEEEDVDNAQRISRWLKFNDTIVEEFVMTDSALEAECFGGSIKTNSSDPLHGHPESRVRHWNAYMLFYEAVSGPEKSHLDVVNGGKSSGSGLGPMSPLPVVPGGDKISQLQALVQKGERRGVFSDSMPPEIRCSVNEENLQFMQHRDVYCREYFEFIRNLTFCNVEISSNLSHPDCKKFGEMAVELATKFLFHTFFRTYRELRMAHLLWVEEMQALLQRCQPACQWLVDFLASDVGYSYIKPFLLDCPSKEVRIDFCEIVGCAMQNYCTFFGCKDGSPLDTIVTGLLKMLEREVVDNWKTCQQFFTLLRNYSSHPQGCRHLLDKDTFVPLVKFLLGSSSSTTKSSDSIPQRRWSSLQVKEFGTLHGTLSQLIRNTDFSAFETETVSGESQSANPYQIPSDSADLVEPSEGMHIALFNMDPSRHFIRECVLTLRECDQCTAEAIGQTLCYCCWNNQTFSACTIEDLQNQVQLVLPNELKFFFKVLTDILLIEDMLQNKRITFTLTGGKYKPDLALFTTIQGRPPYTDTKRTYQGIKFLVGLANRSRRARDYLLSQGDQLQWSVSWLRKKISDYSWSHSSSYSYSNESSSGRTFQRSISAQDTLEEANALLNELEARDSRQKAATSNLSSTNKPSTRMKLPNTIDNVDG